MTPEKLNKLIATMFRINKIKIKILRDYRTEDLGESLNLRSDEDKENFIKDFKEFFSIINASNSSCCDVTLKIQSWKRKISPLGLRDPTESELNEIFSLIDLKVPKTEICRKFNISYPTLKKYLTFKEPNDNESSENPE